MQQKICYDKAWTTEAIEEIEQELHTLNELQEIIKSIAFDSSTNIIPYEIILRDTETLEESLRTTKKALQMYMDSMDNEFYQMYAYYEDKLRESIMLFSEG